MIEPKYALDVALPPHALTSVTIESRSESQTR